MFAPTAGVNEDHVCGSAHCLLVPYWFTKLGLGKEAQETAVQVSARGGTLGVFWKREEGFVVLKGDVRKVADGNVFI